MKPVYLCTIPIIDVNSFFSKVVNKPTKSKCVFEPDIGICTVIGFGEENMLTVVVSYFLQFKATCLIP